MPCVASKDSENMAVCTVCYVDTVTEKTFQHVATNLRMEYILQDYQSLSDAWKLFQGINIYRTYLGITVIPYESEKAPKTCSLCLVKMVNLAKAIYVMTQTFKNGYAEKEKRNASALEVEKLKEMDSAIESRKPKDKNSRERWSTCPSKKVATVHPNPSTAVGQKESGRASARHIGEAMGSKETASRSSPEAPRAISSVRSGNLATLRSSVQDLPIIKPNGLAPPIVKPNDQVPAIVQPNDLAPTVVKPGGQAPPMVKSSERVKEIIMSNLSRERLFQEDSEENYSPKVTGSRNGRPRRSGGRSLNERNPDFLVDLSAKKSFINWNDSSPKVEDLILKVNDSTAKGDARVVNSQRFSSRQSSESNIVPNSEFVPVVMTSQSSTKTSKTRADKSPGQGLQPSKSPSKLPQSSPTKRSRSMSQDTSPRPKRSGGRTLMDRNPDFHMDSTAFFACRKIDGVVNSITTPTKPISDEASIQDIEPAFINHKSPAPRAPNPRNLPSSDKKTNIKPMKKLAHNPDTSPISETELSPGASESRATLTQMERGRSRSGKIKLESSKQKEKTETRPRRSVGRTLSDRKPDFQVEEQGLKSPSNRLSTESRDNMFIQDGKGSVSEDQLPKWKTGVFRAKHLNLLDKALTSVGWGQKHRNAKNMEQEVFQNAMNEEAYVSKISRLVVYFSNGYQPSASSSTPSHLDAEDKSGSDDNAMKRSTTGAKRALKNEAAVKKKSNNKLPGVNKLKPEVPGDTDQEMTTRVKNRQLEAEEIHPVRTKAILERLTPDREEDRMDKITKVVDEVATGKRGVLKTLKETERKISWKSHAIIKPVAKPVQETVGKVRCTLCGQQFAKKSLKNHILKIHKDKECFPCKICHSSYIVNEELEMHLKTEHGDRNVDSILTSETESTASECSASVESSKDSKRSSRSQFQYVLKTGKNGKQGRRYYQIQPEAKVEGICEEFKMFFPQNEQLEIPQNEQLETKYKKTKAKKGNPSKTLSVKKASLPEKAVVSPSKTLLMKKSSYLGKTASNISKDKGSTEIVASEDEKIPDYLHDELGQSEDLSENELHIDLEEKDDEEYFGEGESNMTKRKNEQRLTKKKTEGAAEENENVGKSWWEINQEAEFE